jgi:hypothetical protein
MDRTSAMRCYFGLFLDGTAGAAVFKTGGVIGTPGTTRGLITTNPGGLQYFADGQVFYNLAGTTQICAMAAGGITVTGAMVATGFVTGAALLATASPPLVPVGQVSVGRRALAGQDTLAMRSAQTVERLMQPDLARTMLADIKGTGANAFGFYGLSAGSFLVTGTATPRVSAATSRATRAKRTGIVSSAVAGSLAALATNATTATIVAVGTGGPNGSGGFRAVFRFVISDAATVAAARMFVGLSNTISAVTNVEPSSLINVIGVAQLASSINLQIVFAGAAIQAPVDLGPNFPANTLSADLYELILFSDVNDNTQIGWRVERNPESVTNNFVASGTIPNTTPGTTLPAATTLLGIRTWRTNNTTALAVGLDIVSATITSDF